MSLPRISIVMPSFNQASYLEEAIVSILGQDYPDIEFMIFDGGSTDGSRAIIGRYARSLAYWQSQSDQGQSDAIIQGFSRATGDLIGWVNSDDALLPGALSAVGLAYQQNQWGGLFGGNYILMDQFGRVRRCKRHPANAGWFAKFGIFAFNPPGSFFRHQDYQAVGGLRQDLHYVMDNDLYIRMIAKGTRYVHIPRYLSMFRLHGDQKTTAGREECLIESRGLHGAWPQPLARRAGQSRWRYLFRLWQLVNGNYVRMLLDTFRWRGQHWQCLPEM